MARETILTSDISGRVDAETVAFTLNGQQWQIDLTADEKAEFLQLFAPYLDKARSVGRKSTLTATNSRLSALGYTTRDVREWAMVQGLEVPDRGRVPSDLVSKFIQAHQQDAPSPEPTVN